MAGRITEYIQKTSTKKLLIAFLILEVIFYLVPHIDYALRVGSIRRRLEKNVTTLARNIDGTLHRVLVDQAAYNSAPYRRLSHMLWQAEHKTLRGHRIWARTLAVQSKRSVTYPLRPAPEGETEAAWVLVVGVTTIDEANIGLRASEWKEIEDFINDPNLRECLVTSPYKYGGHYGTRGPWWISGFAWIKTQTDMPVGIVELAADITSLRRSRKGLSYVLMLMGLGFLVWVEEVKLGIVTESLAPYLALKRAGVRERVSVRVPEKEKPRQYARVSGQYFSMEFRKSAGIKSIFRTSAPHFAEVTEIRQTGLDFSTAEHLQAYSLIWLKLTSPFLSKEFSAVGRIVGAYQDPRDPEKFVYSLNFLRRRFEVAKLVK
ncbi:MAG: hypothetical protein AMS15_06940 [Planctomycetes bacterium DG_23]|nr:MAG: hypothetical protein AMS15_06940 [Planctomycetes bacterium DG_23]